MKIRIILITLLTVLLFAGAAGTSNAQHWRGRHHGWYRPGPVVRFVAPIPVPPPVVIDGYGGGYYRPHRYCGPRYYAPRYYGYRHRPHCYR